MRRAGRIIYNGVVAVSLLLCLGTVGVWVRSYWVSDSLIWSDWPLERTYYHTATFWSSRGGLQFSSWHFEGENFKFFDDQHFTYVRKHATQYPAYEASKISPAPDNSRHFAALGFEIVPEVKGKLRSAEQYAVVESCLTLPYYFPTLLFALLPAHYLLRVRRRRRIAARRARGCCVFCGYDLRASAGRCPECGKVEEATDTAALGTPEGMPP